MLSLHQLAISSQGYGFGSFPPTLNVERTMSKVLRHLAHSGETIYIHESFGFAARNESEAVITYLERFTYSSTKGKRNKNKKGGCRKKLLSNSFSRRYVLRNRLWGEEDYTMMLSCSNCSRPRSRDEDKKEVPGLFFSFFGLISSFPSWTSAFFLLREKNRQWIG